MYLTTAQMHGLIPNFLTWMKKKIRFRLPVVHRMDFLQTDNYGEIPFIAGTIMKVQDLHGGNSVCRSAKNFMM